MSESSSKTSMKKGFTAPIIKDNEFNKECSTDHDSKQPKKQKKKNANKEITKEDKSSSENIKPVMKQKQNKEVKLKNDQKPTQSHMKQTMKSNKNENITYQEPAQTVEKQRKPQVSLTDSQYEDIFDAVLCRKSNSGSQQNTPVDEPNTQVEQKLETPRAGGSKEEGKNRNSEPTTPAQKPKAVPQVSPWGSHFSKQASQASSILKEIETESLIGSSSCVRSPSSSSDSSAESSLVQASPPQQPIKDQRKRLEELQRCRNVGVWVYCDRMSCQKVRYLPYITDPQDVPEVWYCHMHKDLKYNNCQYEEHPPSAEEEEDMIYNSFTAGSVVWARVPGYPWWPAMVDDDPDLEQYYWLLEDFFTVTHYHVVFFDEGAVTRAWVDLKNISSFARHDNKYKQTVSRGIDFSYRIRVAKEQANDALNLNSYQRLNVYSFIARYKGPISTSQKKKQNAMKQYKLKSKKGVKADHNSWKNTNIESLATKKDKSEKRSIKNKRQVKENSTSYGNSKKQKMDTEKYATSVEDKPASKTKRKVVRKTSQNSQVSMDNASEICTMKHAKSISKVTDVDMEGTYLASHDINANVDIQQDSQGVGSFKDCESETPSFVGSNATKEPDPDCLPGPSKHNIKDKAQGASYIEDSDADKSKLLCQPELSQINTEDTIGSIVEPSQMFSGASQESKLSPGNNTMADYFMAESEDGVVPSSQQSLPFEE